MTRSYSKPEAEVLKFTLEDVLTTSSGMVTTTTPSTAPTTTLPGSTSPSTTSGGISIGGNGSGDIIIDLSDY